MAAPRAPNDELGHRFDPDFTRNVINAIGPQASPRTRKVFGSLIQHLHDFCRENEVTVEEFMHTIDLVSSQISSYAPNAMLTEVADQRGG